jgi:ABC-type transport system involved in multi-copper enzyme maturation permease subunit
MTWVAWRVQRLQFVAAAGAVLVIGLWLAVCGHFGDSSWSQSTIKGDIFVFTALPGLFGLALGTSLVGEEVNNKTNRLAWSQSVSRTRWLSSKLAVGSVVVGVLTSVLVPILNWWTGAVNLGLDIQPKLFDITGIVVVSYALFAFMLGVTLGAIIQRPAWAFAASVPVFGFIRLVVGGLRSTLASPASLIQPFQESPPNGWVLHSGYLPLGLTSPAPGRTWSGNAQRVDACFNRVSSLAGQAHCAIVAHVHWVWQYQPESHYWSLQWTETGIYVGLAFVCSVATLIKVRGWRI